MGGTCGATHEWETPMAGQCTAMLKVPSYMAAEVRRAQPASTWGVQMWRETAIARVTAALPLGYCNFCCRRPERPVTR